MTERIEREGVRERPFSACRAVTEKEKILLMKDKVSTRGQDLLK